MKVDVAVLGGEVVNVVAERRLATGSIGQVIVGLVRGEHRVTEGSIDILGAKPGGRDALSVCATLASTDVLSPRLTILEGLSLIAMLAHQPSPLLRAREALVRMDLKRFEESYPDMVGSDVLRAATFATLFVRNARVWVIDGATVDVGQSSGQHAMDAIARAATEGVAVLLASDRHLLGREVVLRD